MTKWYKTRKWSKCYNLYLKRQQKRNTNLQSQQQADHSSYIKHSILWQGGVVWNSRGAVRLLVKALVVLHIQSHSTLPTLEARLVPYLCVQTYSHTHNQSCIMDLTVKTNAKVFTAKAKDQYSNQVQG